MKKNAILQPAAAVLLLLVMGLSGCMQRVSVSPEAPPRWWKGNTHTHTFWSDGKNYPEMVAAWYKDHGYHFLTLSDHNTLSQGQRWAQINKRHTEGDIHQKYIDRFGPDWVQTRCREDKQQVRLKPLNEFRHLLEEPGRFMLVQGEELTPKKGHVNGINTLERIGAKEGATDIEILQNNLNAVLEQEQRTGQEMLAHVNHPNWRWDFEAEDLIPLVGEQFFELYNGSSGCNNFGDENHIGTERMWDVILAMRLGALNLPVVYAVATDDTHDYHKTGPKASAPGRGWVVVRSKHLTPESIIQAMEAGDFYASNGVTLNDVQFDGQTLTVKIDKERGVSYTTRFIGTRKGFDPTITEQTHKDKYKDGDKDHTVKVYSDQIGVTFKEVKGTTASYTLTGDELYVRATVTSDKPKENHTDPGELETAWTQPVLGQ